MPYYLGIDIGTTYTAAAVWRDGHAEVCTLGGRAAVVPSTVFLRDDGEVLIGEAAERRAVLEPSRVAREFKRRVGDSVPVLVGGSPFSADALMAKVLGWTVDQVAEREGGPPAGLVVSHPATWGPFKRDLVRQSIGVLELPAGGFVAEPVAAAVYYASQERTAPGTTVAVYDLGGGTFDAAVLRRTDAGWAILGRPCGIERLGGVDFDEAVFQRVCGGDIGAAVEALDPDEPGTWSAVARLRQECVAAKEALASDTAVEIPVLLPDLRRSVRLTRSELEELVRPSLLETVGALKQALRSADVDVVDAVLLVGGSSRLPLVAEIVGAELGLPVAVDAHPKHAVALGAAIVAADRTVAAATGETVVPGEVEPQAEDTTRVDGSPLGAGTVTPAGPGDGPGRGWGRRALVAAVAAVILGGAGAVALAHRTDANSPGRPASTTTTHATPTTAPPAVAVPDVVGLTRQQAQDRLAAAGLQVQIGGRPTTDPNEAGVVLAQDPPAADGVDRGTTVRLTVGVLQASPRRRSGGGNSTPPATSTTPGTAGGGSTATTETTTSPPTTTATSVPQPTTIPTTSAPPPVPTTIPVIR